VQVGEGETHALLSLSLSFALRVGVHSMRGGTARTGVGAQTVSRSLAGRVSLRLVSPLIMSVTVTFWVFGTTTSEAHTVSLM
jgi:hypothetical protein